MMDASVLHWKNLANFSTPEQSVYVYDHGSRSAEKPGREIEWPIVWLLSAFPRKHIFVPQGILETNHMNTDAIRFTRRVGRGHGLFARIAHFFQAFISRYVVLRVAPTGIRHATLTATRRRR